MTYRHRRLSSANTCPPFREIDLLPPPNACLSAPGETMNKSTHRGALQYHLRLSTVSRMFAAPRRPDSGACGPGSQR